ncbi:epimerase [Comamonas testosteroni]|uniref:Epimerase n=1 Tax=Comamonas testosteroni TaxID=285 RepID=A0A373FJF6_COMTE|nr:DoxX-like family protein [Comamonas testosteroni]RGE44077.1 epimerase [Comamonas testosteroni]
MHASLVIVWLGTAVVSALDDLGLSGLNHEGARLLAAGGIASPDGQALLIWSGLLADLLIGLALLLRPGRTSYLAALAMMCAMTLIGTALQPALWLHPLGPLLKNLPIAAMLWFLLQANYPNSKVSP